jgi:Tol biopolymer transport system component
VTKSTDLYELYMSRRDGSEPRQLASSNFRLSQPAWSPDGGAIVFCLDEGFGKQNLYQLRLFE